MKTKSSKKVTFDDTNYITIEMVKKALSTLDGKIMIDRKIIGFFNERDMNVALKGFQKKYDMGTPLEKISVKMTHYFNWKVFEFFPMEESLNKYLFLRNYTKVHFKESQEYSAMISHIEGKIDNFEESNKNGS